MPKMTPVQVCADMQDAAGDIMTTALHQLATGNKEEARFLADVSLEIAQLRLAYINALFNQRMAAA